MFLRKRMKSFVPRVQRHDASLQMVTGKPANPYMTMWFSKQKAVLEGSKCNLSNFFFPLDFPHPELSSLFLLHFHFSFFPLLPLLFFISLFFLPFVSFFPLFSPLSLFSAVSDSVSIVELGIFPGYFPKVWEKH